MQVINTPDAVPDKFGPGLNGFKGQVPPVPPPTQLSAEWFDAIQMELVNIVISQGIPLDALVFDQAVQAINQWSFVDPKITGSLTIEAPADLRIEAGATLTADDGSLCTFDGDVVVDVNATFTVKPAADFQGNVMVATTKSIIMGDTCSLVMGANPTVTLGANPTVSMGADAVVTVGDNAVVTYGAAAAVSFGLSGTVTAGVFDTTNTGEVQTNSLQLYTDATPGATDGQLQWDGRRLSIGTGAGANVVKAPRFDYKDTATTAAALTDIPGLDINVDVPDTQDILIRLDAHQFVDNVSGPQLRIRATNGVDAVIIVKLGSPDQALSILPNSPAANATRPNRIQLRWRPTDDFPVPDNTNWTFFVQHGIAAGNVTTTAATLEVQFL